MAYTTDTNTEIVNFLNRAQTKLGQLAEEVTDMISRRKHYESYCDKVELGYELDCFIDALDNNYNDWTEKEIITYIHFWDSKAQLRQIPYVQRSNYNLNVNFETQIVSSGDGGEGFDGIVDGGTV